MIRKRRLRFLIWLFASALIVAVQINGFSQVGASWEQATASAAFEARWGHTSLVYNNKLWVIGGCDVISLSNLKNDVWYSADGVNWTQATAAAAFKARCWHTSTVYDNKMWVIGGYAGYRSNDVWYSTDGVNWNQATDAAAFSGRQSHTSIVYDNKMWVIGGFGLDGVGVSRRNDVWYSTDGVNWLQATSAAAFSARRGHTSVVYDDRMWVIGGEYGVCAVKNDVWHSTDGVNWAQAAETAEFGERYLHTSVVYDNKIWTIGGTKTGGYRNDVWYSINGATWTQATEAAEFTSRGMHASVVYNNKMWVIGGDYASAKNDVWYSPPEPSPAFTPTPTCESVPPKLTIKAVIDSENSDYVTINLYADEPIDCASAYLVVVPHSASHAPTTVASMYKVDDKTCESLYLRNQGFGDTKIITAYAADLCGNIGHSDGTFECEVISNKPVIFSHNRINPTSRGDKALIRYQISQSGRVQIEVFDKLGQLVCTLVDEQAEAGKYQVTWDGRDKQGAIVASGIYFVTVRTSEYSVKDNIVVVK